MIRFRMTKIGTEQFAILSENPPQGQFSSTLSATSKYSATDRIIAMNLTFEFGDNDSKFMILAIQCDFQFNPDDWENAKSDNKVVIPKSTLEYLMAQSVGVARGILHCKTEGTSFNNIIIPPLNVTSLINEDMVITLD